MLIKIGWKYRVVCFTSCTYFLQVKSSSIAIAQTLCKILTYIRCRKACFRCRCCSRNYHAELAIVTEEKCDSHQHNHNDHVDAEQNVAYFVLGGPFLIQVLSNSCLGVSHILFKIFFFIFFLLVLVESRLLLLLFAIVIILVLIPMIALFLLNFFFLFWFGLLLILLSFIVLLFLSILGILLLQRSFRVLFPICWRLVDFDVDKFKLHCDFVNFTRL